MGRDRHVPAEPREWLGVLQARQDFVFSTHTDSLAFGSEWLPNIILRDAVARLSEWGYHSPSASAWPADDESDL